MVRPGRMGGLLLPMAAQAYAGCDRYIRRLTRARDGTLVRNGLMAQQAALLYKPALFIKLNVGVGFLKRLQGMTVKAERCGRGRERPPQKSGIRKSQGSIFLHLQYGMVTGQAGNPAPG